ncbi:MAG: hypothetical protein JXQ72_15955 [Anaerolineae bacterium]|nr:hypothetical protein [Anaerolineae bacterium]
MSTTDPVRLIRIDSNHFAVRFLVPVLAVAATVFAHFFGMRVLDALFGDSVDPGCVMLPSDFLILIGLAYVIEYGLKRLLPGRRSAELSERALVLVDSRRKHPNVTEIAWDSIVNVMAWRFQVQRRTRVPKGWFCLAVHLLQDERDVILYTFMPQADAEAVPGYGNFVRLRPRKETRSNTDLHAVAEQRRLLKLEDARWDDGAEIGSDDFIALLTVMQRRVPGWM